MVLVGVVGGAVAGRWNHPCSAILLGLPVIVLAARHSHRRLMLVVAIATMAAWALVREAAAGEPLWSSWLTFATSLIVLGGFGWILESLDRAQKQADRLAQTEPLTGLLNRNAFFSQLELELGRSRRDGCSLALAYLDCDHFKAWNDSQGHRAGDELLQTVARTLRTATRSSDVVARLGGDEFGLLFPEITAADAKQVVRRLHDELRTVMADGHGPVTVSIGLAVLEPSLRSTSEVADLADQLLYEAKRSGRDRVVSQLPSGAAERAHVPESEQDLRRSD